VGGFRWINHTSDPFMGERSNKRKFVRIPRPYLKKLMKAISCQRSVEKLFTMNQHCNQDTGQENKIKDKNQA